jgi:hypothetical protein
MPARAFAWLQHCQLLLSAASLIDWTPISTRLVLHQSRPQTGVVNCHVGLNSPTVHSMCAAFGELAEAAVWGQNTWTGSYQTAAQD